MPKLGELGVANIINFDFENVNYWPVKDAAEAVEIINREANKQLKQQWITDNMFDLEVFEEIDGEFDWNTWYDNETGDDIRQYGDAMEASDDE